MDVIDRFIFQRVHCRSYQRAVRLTNTSLHWYLAIIHNPAALLRSDHQQQTPSTPENQIGIQRPTSGPIKPPVIHLDQKKDFFDLDPTKQPSFPSRPILFDLTVAGPPAVCPTDTVANSDEDMIVSSPDVNAYSVVTQIEEGDAPSLMPIPSDTIRITRKKTKREQAASRNQNRYAKSQNTFSKFHLGALSSSLIHWAVCVKPQLQT